MDPVCCNKDVAEAILSMNFVCSGFQPLQSFLHPHRAQHDKVISKDGTMDPFWDIIQNIIHKDDGSLWVMKLFPVVLLLSGTSSC